MAEVKEDDLLPGEVSESDLETEAPSEHLTEKRGVKRLELKKTAPDLSESIAPPTADLSDKISRALRPETTGGAALAGLGTGVTAGFGDELYGLLSANSDDTTQRFERAQEVADAKERGTYDPSAGAPEIPGVTSYQLKRPGQPTLTKTAVARAPADTAPAPIPSWSDLYAKHRDYLRGEQKKAQEAHPGAYLGGELVGGLAMPIPGPGKAKGFAKVGKYALQGAGVGALSGLGNSEADSVGGALLDTGVGFGAGGVVGGGLGAVGAAADPLLQKWAARNAYKALDPYMKTLEANLTKEMGRQPKPAEIMAVVEKLGRRVLDENIIPEGPLNRFANPEELGNAAALARDEAGQLKGAWADMLQEQMGGRPISMEALANAVDSEALKAGQDPAKQAVARALLREAGDVRKAGVNRALAGESIDLTLPEAERMKTGLQKAVYGLDAGRRGGPAQDAKELVAKLAKEMNESAIESKLGPDELAQFQAVKDRFGELAGISDTAGYGAMRNFRNNAISLGDRQAAGIGASLGSSTPEKILGSAGLGAINKLGRERGAAGLARTLQNRAQSSSLLNPATEKLADYFADVNWEDFLKSKEEKP